MSDSVTNRGTSVEPMAVCSPPHMSNFAFQLGMHYRCNWKLAVHLFFFLFLRGNLSGLIVPVWHLQGLFLTRSLEHREAFCLPGPHSALCALSLIVASSPLNCDSAKRACWLDAMKLPVMLSPLSKILLIFSEAGNRFFSLPPPLQSHRGLEEKGGEKVICNASISSSLKQD